MPPVPPTPPPPYLRSRRAPLRGRDQVVDELIALLDQSADGHGGARTLIGDAGIGKSSIVDEVWRRLGSSSTPLDVIRLKGLEAEVEMAWSGLASLLDSVLGGLTALPPERSAAVRAALALSDERTPVEPFLVSVAARDLLVEAAETVPIVVLIDDLQWIDLPSRLAIAYIAADLDVERLAVIATRRSGTDDSTDLGSTIEISGLPDEAGDQLLQDVGVTSEPVRRALLAASDGNALVLVEAANLLEPAERSGRAPLPDPLPVGRSGQRAAELVLERLAPESRAALIVLAADPDGDLVSLRAAITSAGHDPAALDLAAAAGVIDIDGAHVAFRHPLLRSATYHAASRAARRSAHRALAETLPEGSPARAWHLARAALGPDEEVAAALDAAASMTAHLGAPALAARTWEAAARLSPARPARARRFRLAASAVLDGGRAEEAGELLTRAEDAVAGLPDDDLESARRLQLRCRLPMSAGGVVGPAAMLREAARGVEDLDVGVAADLLLDALARQIDDGALADVAATAQDAIALRDRLDDERARRIDITRGGLLLVQGEAAGESLLERYREIVGAERSPEDNIFLVGVVAPALGYLRRDVACGELLDLLETDLRARGAIRPLVDVLASRAMAFYGSSFPAGLAAALEAVTLADGLGMPEGSSLAAAALCVTAAVMGDRERCEQGAALLADVADAERRALGPIGLAYLALNEGRLDDAEQLYDQIAEVSPLGRGFFRWETEWAETLARSGRRAEAADLLHRLVAGGWPAALPPFEYARTRGLVTDDEDEAQRNFARSAAEAAAAGNPFAEGRAQLAWGEQLRRVRRRAEARVHLERAAELFVKVGAHVFADRAASEVRAAGGQASEEVVAHRLLTPHELQIARLAVGGASTRDVAAKLFISPRTIEAHLSSIFRKLGVRNRRELSARALDDPVLQP